MSNPGEWFVVIQPTGNRAMVPWGTALLEATRAYDQRLQLNGCARPVEGERMILLHEAVTAPATPCDQRSDLARLMDALPGAGVSDPACTPGGVVPAIVSRLSRLARQAV